MLEIYSFVQGLVLAIYAIAQLKRPYLGALLIIISTLIFFHIFYTFEWFVAYPHFIFTEAFLWYTIGPLFYLLTGNIFNQKVTWKHMLHFIPTLLFLGFMLPFYVEPAITKVNTFYSLFSEQTYQPDWNRYLFSMHILIYLIISHRKFRVLSEGVKESSAESELVFDSIASLILRYYLIFSAAGILMYFIVSNSYHWSSEFYGAYYLGLSVLIHITFYYFLFRFPPVIARGEAPGQTKYHSSTLSDEEMTRIIDQVSAYISQHEVYKNPELRLRMVSDQLNIPSHHISQALNQKLKTSFFELVNTERIKGMEQSVHLPHYSHYTLSGIASDHGFKSASSFFRVFKKLKGQTPKEYFKL